MLGPGRVLGPGLEEQGPPQHLGLKGGGGLAGQQDGESHTQEPRAVVRGCSQTVGGRWRNGHAGQLSFLPSPAWLPEHIHNSGVHTGQSEDSGWGVQGITPRVCPLHFLTRKPYLFSCCAVLSRSVVSHSATL